MPAAPLQPGPGKTNERRRASCRGIHPRVPPCRHPASCGLRYGRPSDSPRIHRGCRRVSARHQRSRPGVPYPGTRSEPSRKVAWDALWRPSPLLTEGDLYRLGRLSGATDYGGFRVGETPSASGQDSDCAPSGKYFGPPLARLGHLANDLDQPEGHPWVWPWRLSATAGPLVPWRSPAAAMNCVSPTSRAISLASPVRVQRPSHSE